ncbi:lipopolysaccharide biosynthesis protein [Erythrobacter litoralis]|uniref:lipopolysaccharide biosynthesis protein n=1 Tax=Erythrobacter litoralis TaxID=39960 RepID=UPI002434B9B3|nr:lipopolysaccharide biosynthesis protein [Erythrobacter litoralis]MDG6078814.1 lipopolysaccharide biosynthesis protein [Erythrobacter litoralis]
MKFERQHDNLGKRAFAGAVLLGVGRMLTRISTLISLVILARLLTPADYGLVALAFTVVTLIQAVFDTKDGAALIVRQDLDRAHLDTVFTIQLLRGSAMAAILFLTAEPLAGLLGSARLYDVLRALALMPLLDALRNPGLVVYSRNLDFRREVVRDVIAAAIATGLGIAVAFWLRNYWALVVISLATSGLQSLVSYWRVPYRPRFGTKDWRHFVSFGGWLAAERFAAEANTVAPRLMLWIFTTPAILGLFTIARDLQSIPMNEMLEPVRRTLLPSFSALKHSPEAMRAAFRKAQGVIGGFVLPAGIGIAVLALEIIRTLVGRDWLDAAIVLQILAPAMAFKVATGPVGNVAIALGHLRANFWRSLLIAVATYPVLWLTIAEYGLAGAAIGMALLALLRIVLNAFLIRHLLSAPLLGIVRNNWRAILASGIMGVCITALPGRVERFTTSFESAVLLAYKVPIGVLVYFLSVFVLWHISGKPDGFEKTLLHYTGHGRERATALAGRFRRSWAERRG